MIMIDNTSTEDLERCLREMLDAVGIRPDHPEVALVWRVFKEFAKIPIDGHLRDDCAFQCAITTSCEEEERIVFVVAFLRQISFESEGEYTGMMHVACELEYSPDAKLASFDAMVWSYSFPDLDSFFRHVEDMPEFVIPTTKYSASMMSIRTTHF